MPRARPVTTRQTIIDQHEAGTSLPTIAHTLDLSPWTVRKLWRRYRRRGAAGVAADYDRCGQRGPRGSVRVYRAACWRRRRHPSWGAELIRTVLRDRWPDQALPHRRTIERWWRAAGLLAPRRRVRTAAPPTPRLRASRPHHIWQVDAVEGVRLGDGRTVSWLGVTDEASGAVLAAVVSPPGDLASGAADRGAGDAAPGIHALGAAGAHPV